MCQKAIKRINVLCVDKQFSSKGLAEQLNKNKATILRWNPNAVKPPVKPFVTILELPEDKYANLINE